MHFLLTAGSNENTVVFTGSDGPGSEHPATHSPVSQMTDYLSCLPTHICPARGSACIPKAVAPPWSLGRRAPKKEAGHSCRAPLQGSTFDGDSL